MRVIAKHNLIVESFNAKNKKGNKLRKSREIKEGEAFEVKREFTATGGATHGLKCLELIGPNGELYQVAVADFNAEGQEQEQTNEKTEVKKEENEAERLLRCIREIVEDPKNEEFTFGFKRGGFNPLLGHIAPEGEQEKERIQLGKLVGDKKVFVQGIMDSRYIYPQTVGNVKEHAVIYFQDFAGNAHKKWVYPSKNKSDDSIKGKIRSIMREWVAELVEKEEKAQGVDRETRKEQEQLGNDLAEFRPAYVECGRGVTIGYGNPKGNFSIRVLLNECGNYRVSLRTATNPAFTKEDLEALLKALGKAT